MAASHYFSRCISSRQPLYHAVGMGVLSKHKFPPGEGYQNTSFPRGPPGEILSFEIWIRCESTSPKYEIKFITNLSHLSRNYHEIYHGSQIEGSLPSAHRGGNPVTVLRVSLFLPFAARVQFALCAFTSSCARALFPPHPSPHSLRLL